MMAAAWPEAGGITGLVFVAWLPLFHAERLFDARAAGRRRAFYPYALPAFLLWNGLSTWWFAAVSEPWVTRLISVGAPVLVNTLLMGLPWIWRRMARDRLGRRWAPVALVAAWLAFERLHHAWDLQWPWLSLGNAFGTHPLWVQWYEWTGMLGGSLWVLLVNLLLDAMVVRMGIDRWRAARIGLAAMLCLAIPLAASIWRFNHYRFEHGRPLEAVVVQPSVDPYTEKFGGIDPLEQLDRMLDLASRHMTDSTRLVVMPETALQERAVASLTEQGIRFSGLWENALDSSRSVRRLRSFQRLHPRTALLCGMSSDR
jgi:apolipoprotein N-acyltransferase